MTDSSKEAVASLQAVLEEERQRRKEAEANTKALIEEFTSCNDFDEVRKKFKERIKDFAPQALSEMMSLCTTAESESVRASMCKWFVEWAMSDKLDSSSNEIGDLLKQLKRQPTSASSES